MGAMAANTGYLLSLSIIRVDSMQTYSWNSLCLGRWGIRGLMRFFEFRRWKRMGLEAADLSEFIFGSEIIIKQTESIAFSMSIPTMAKRRVYSPF